MSVAVSTCAKARLQFTRRRGAVWRRTDPITCEESRRHSPGRRGHREDSLCVSAGDAKSPVFGSEARHCDFLSHDLHVTLFS